MFGLVDSLAEKTVCASAAAFTSGVVIGYNLGQTLQGEAQSFPTLRAAGL